MKLTTAFPFCERKICPFLAINARPKEGQSTSALPPISDVNLLGDVKRVICPSSYKLEQLAA